jgi:hypothetical protein
VQFTDLDAAVVQTAILGAHEKGTLVSDLLKRLRNSPAPLLPQLEGTVTADSLILGPVTIENAKAQLKIAPTGIEITALDGKMLGGGLHATGALVTGDKPDYTITAVLQNLNPTAVGQLIGQNWRGGTLDANGNVELAGYTGSDLASSAKGTLHFEWRNGAASGAGSPPEMGHFDRWSANAEIADGKVTFGKNELAQESLKRAIAAGVVLAEQSKLIFGSQVTPPSPKPVQTNRQRPPR